MPIKISLVLAVWNTSHLLRRSVETYLKQDVDPDDWELIVVDDKSQDDVPAALEPLKGKLRYRYVRLEHPYGMRGNTVSFNTAFSMAQAPIIAETTPECLLPPDAVRQLLEPHEQHPRCFVALKTYNLRPNMQKRIDTVDWRKDIMAVAQLPEWDDAWVQNNVKVTHFGTHQICSIRKDVFYEVIGANGFPLYCDYGSEDPLYAGRREQRRVLDITLPNSCMAIHQWHPPFQYWMSKGYGPMLNAWAHTMDNYMHDTSGEVPAGGTCQIWDGGSHQRLTPEQCIWWQREFDDLQLALGVPEAAVCG